MNKLDRAAIEKTSWGADFLHEVELVIAQATLSEMQSGKTVYNDVLHHRVADFARPLDLDVRVEFLGIIHVPPNAEAPYKRFDELNAMLASKPRGAWAVVEADGKFDAVMSDGHCGQGRLPGNAFAYTLESAPAFNDRSLYAGTLSRLVYDERNRIQNMIVEASIAAADVKPGAVVRNAEIGTIKYSAVELVRKIDAYYSGGGAAFEIRVNRRGVKPASKIIGPAEFMRLFEVPAILPADLVAEDGLDRSRSLMESRQACAQSAWVGYSEENRPDVVPYNTKGPFHYDGDVLSRIVYNGAADAPQPCGSFTVEFAPGSNTIRDVRLDGLDRGMTP